MKNILLLFICISFISCTLNKIDNVSQLMSNTNSVSSYVDLARKSQENPYFRVNFGGFLVDDADSSRPNATPEDHRRARIMSAGVKKRILNSLDVIRFVFNTPEFASNMLHTPLEFQSGVGPQTGPYGTVNRGDYLDKKRILEVIRNFQMKVTIRKLYYASEISGVGIVGKSQYVKANNDPQVKRSAWIGMPNYHDWDGQGYKFNGHTVSPFIMGVIVHEFMHNAGFSHYGGDTDTTCNIERVFRQTLDQIGSQNKYKDKIARLIPYYATINSKWLGFDTIPIPKSSKQRSMEEFTLDDEEIIVCEYDPMTRSHRMRTIKASELGSLYGIS
ncbi:MAG: hypothetical protein ACRCVW_03920 [Brevinema sp.]